jgi:hypothetical protein
MTFTVTWSLVALAQLPAIENAHGDRQAVDQAVQWVDYTLRRIPMNVGESRASLIERLWYGDVLGVYYRVDSDNYRVRIISVGPARRH